MNLPIRLRLAAFFTIAVALILVGAGIVTYQLLYHSMLAEIGRDVVTRARTFQAGRPGPPYNLDTFSASDVFIQVQTSAGTVTALSANLAGRSLPLPEKARRGQVAEVRLSGRPLFLAAARLPGGGYVVVARSPVTTYRTLATLQRLLTIVVLAAVLLTAVASWGYARAALRPIDRIVDAARAVRDSHDLTRRVAHTGRRDEIGRLADTFNGMLAELDAAHQALDSSHQQMRRFLADCSHELRAPLARIRAAADLLTRMGGTDPREQGEATYQSQVLADIAADADRMARRVRELLILARADAGAAIQRRPVRLGDVLAAAIRHGERMAGPVQFSADPGAVTALHDVTVAGDHDYLLQALLILIDNACKYTPPPGHIQIAARLDGDCAEISVTDTGIGIPADDIDHIYERFYRGRNAAAATGTGLGLAIAAWVIGQHGGQITLTSTPGLGSRFAIRLPVQARLPGQPTWQPGLRRPGHRRARRSVNRAGRCAIDTLGDRPQPPGTHSARSSKPASFMSRTRPSCVPGWAPVPPGCPPRETDCAPGGSRLRTSPGALAYLGCRAGQTPILGGQHPEPRQQTRRGRGVHPGGLYGD